jgi:hypothetical protein
MKPPEDISESVDIRLHRVFVFKPGVDEVEGYRATVLEMVTAQGVEATLDDIEFVNFDRIDVPGVGEVDVADLKVKLTVRLPPIHPEVVRIDIVKRRLDG